MDSARLEPMMISKAPLHFPQPMLQFFSLTLAECHVSTGPIELYGYIATRDDRDWMRNYIFNHSRDDPIIVQQGSLIEMTGPKRGIEIDCPVLVEFDMRVKNGEQEKDDHQLIDGAFGCYDRRAHRPLKHRIYGTCGTVDMSLTYVEEAVEATIEVVISQVQGGFNLSLSSFIEVMDKYEEIQLFHGIVDQPMGFRRFVVAVTWDTVMLLKFNLASYNVERCCSFKAQVNGYATQSVELDHASVSVKVSWSTTGL